MAKRTRGAAHRDDRHEMCDRQQVEDELHQRQDVSGLTLGR